MMAAIWQLYDRATVALLALCGAGMFAVVVANVFTRYVLNDALIWGEEVARFLMIWGTMVGVAIAYRARAHVAIGLVTPSLPPRIGAGVAVLCHVLTLATAAMLWRSGAILQQALGGMDAPSSGIRMAWVYAAMPVGAVLLAIEALRLLWADVERMRGRGAAR